MAGSQSAIDPTTEPKYHLTELPSEVIHIICDYLFPAHIPALVTLLSCSNISPFRTAHPLLLLAATSKRLRLEIDAWCLHYLKEHASITGYKDLKTEVLQQRRNVMTGRSGLLHWITRDCVFCGKKSQRTAIFVNTLHCCAACDKAQWPDKITKTDAKAEFDLRDHQLLPDLRLSKDRDEKMPKLRYGTYYTSNILTTMFLRHEVRALACYIHGDIEEHIRKKRAAKEERAEKRKRATMA